MKLEEAISNTHRIAEDIHNYAIRDELANLWNCIIDNIIPLREALDVICKYCPEDKWTLTSEKMPKPNELVWVCDKYHEVAVCKLLAEYTNGDWYDSNDEWFYFSDSVIAWRPYLVPEPYIPEEEVKDGWHPVSENPPKKESHYWVQLCGSDGKYAGMHECIWTDSGRIDANMKTDWHWIGNPQYTKIVAWRKLPDVYTEEEQ